LGTSCRKKLVEIPQRQVGLYTSRRAVSKRFNQLLLRLLGSPQRQRFQSLCHSTAFRFNPLCEETLPANVLWVTIAAAAIEVKIKRRHRRVRAFLKLRPTEAVLKIAQTADATFYCNEKREMPPRKNELTGV
jgi:hypothetical protein